MFNREKFLRYISTDLFLKRVWAERKRTFPKDQLDKTLVALFNTYVLENSVALRAYQTF